MEAAETWDTVNGNSDIIALLQLIQACMIQRQTCKNAVHTLHDAESLFYSFHQTRHMSNSDYYDKFKENVLAAERLGSTIGVHEMRVAAYLQAVHISRGETWFHAQSIRSLRGK